MDITLRILALVAIAVISKYIFVDLAINMIEESVGAAFGLVPRKFGAVWTWIALPYSVALGCTMLIIPYVLAFGILFKYLRYQMN